MMVSQWPALVAPPLVAITPFSPESLGDALAALGFRIDAAIDQAVANHRMYYYPFILSKPFVAVKAFAYNGLNTGGEDGDASVGVYDAKGKMLIDADFTTVADDDNIMVEVDITDTLLGPGLHYMGCVGSGLWHVFATTPDIHSMRLMGVQHAIVTTAGDEPTFTTLAGTPRVHVIGITGRTVV